MPINTKPTAEMKAEAERGLSWREEFNRGGTAVGVARARDIINGANLSEETINRMVSYFARHEVDKKAEGFRPGEDGYPSAGRIAWALWGGDAGQRWSKRKQNELETEDKYMENLAQIKTDERINKTFRCNLECKEEENSEGVKIGVIEGFASTWDEDRGNDVILQGAFEKTLNRHAAEGRPVRMLLQHNSQELIGGFPIEFAKETPEGLFVKGEINLEVEKGRAAYSLAKQGVLTDMSIGFSIPSRDSVEFSRDEDRIVRVIKEVELWEISLVSEPMNPAARVMAVKSATPFLDLPLADRARPWDSEQAIGRVRELTGSIELPSESYRDAFFWYDPEATEEFGSYKLPFVDVIDGNLVAVPRGIFAAAAALQGARGGVDIPEADREAVIANVARYYEKLGLESPFGEKRFDVTIAETCESLGEVEDLLKASGFTNAAGKAIIRIIKSLGGREGGLDDMSDREDSADLEGIEGKLDEINKSLELGKIKRTLDKIS